MTRTITGLCVAGAISCAISLAAQTPTSTTTQRTTASDATAHDITVTGCVAKAADGRFTLTNAMVEPMATGTTAGTTTAGSTTAGTTTGATTTAGTTTAGTTTATSPTVIGTTSASTPAMTWTLTGGTDLDKHLGHKIQVMGQTTWFAGRPMTSTNPTGTTTGTTGTTAGATTGTTTAGARMTPGPTVDVRTIKMLTASCP